MKEPSDNVTCAQINEFSSLLGLVLARLRSSSPEGATTQVEHVSGLRGHEALEGKTSSEACGIRVEGKNKWLTLIQNAKHEQR